MKLWIWAIAGLMAPLQVSAEATEESLRMNLPPGVTSISHQAYSLHMMMFWVSLAIGLLVFTLMSWALIRYRRKPGREAAHFSNNLALEIAWTVVPMLILVVVGVFITRTLLQDNRETSPDYIVDIHGSQWKWHYSYADKGVGFYSNIKSDSRDASKKGAKQKPSSVAYYLRDVDHPLVLPVHKKILLRITSDDVIHSWWVPQLGFKRDAIPGFINKAELVIDKPGTYRGQCAELCGMGHAFMPIVVKAVTQQEFQTWLVSKQHQGAEEKQEESGKWTMAMARKRGKQTFNSVCATCHQEDGKGVPGTFPALDGSKVVNGPLAGHLDIVIHGSDRNPAMRAFGKEMNDRQIAAVLTYERNAWSNHTGDLVTPEQVEKAR